MKTYLQLNDLGEDIEAEVDYDFTPGTKDVMYMSNGDPGYPGDSEEIDITGFKVKFGKKFIEIPFDCLEPDAQDRIYSQISKYESEHQGEYDGPDYDGPEE